MSKEIYKFKELFDLEQQLDIPYYDRWNKQDFDKREVELKKLPVIQSSLQLEDKYDELSRLGTDLIKAIENKVPYIQLPDDEVLYTSLHKLKQEIKDNL